MLQEYNYATFDFETGGFEPTENPITSFAIIIRDYQMNEIGRYSTYVKPYNNLVCTKSALDFTKITLKMLEEKGIDAEQLYKDMVGLLKPLCKGKNNWMKVILVGHNISKFDMGFWEYLFKLFNDDIYNYVEKFMLDTLYLARWKWGNIEVDNLELATCCNMMGIELADGHDAMNDAEGNDKLFLAFTKEQREGITTSLNVETAEERARQHFKF